MIQIVDYEAGNLTSVKRALDHLGIVSQITPDAKTIAEAERIIFPGVGAAGSAVRNLRERGMDQALCEAFEKGVPILGICIGAQILLSHSEEDDTDCLGLIPGETVRFQLSDPTLKIPHMGWDGIEITQPHPLLAGVRPDDMFYFVHSYYLKPEREEHVAATTDYETVFASALMRENLFATQFHPEKSGPPGLDILRRFATWEGNPC